MIGSVMSAVESPALTSNILKGIDAPSTFSPQPPRRRPPPSTFPHKHLHLPCNRPATISRRDKSDHCLLPTLTHSFGPRSDGCRTVH